jgi:hypothetical protein
MNTLAPSSDRWPQSGLRWRKNRLTESISKTMATKARPDLHPTLMRRVGDAAEIGLLAGTLAAIWISVGLVVVATILG